jgi:hypothetical protein
MAEVIYQAIRHNCYEEIGADIDEKAMYLGSIVKCSCGQHFIKRDGQRDGQFWEKYMMKSPQDR